MRNKIILWMATAATVFCSCQQDIPMVSLGVDDIYYIYRMQKLKLSPAFAGDSYQWHVKDGQNRNSLVSSEREYIFLASKEGTYELILEIVDGDERYVHSCMVNVLHEEVEYSPYIASVYEYRPAPGQFVNLMPQYEDGDTEESMRKKAEECISGTNNVMITLGAYGGYVTFGFDHTVMNVPGEKDFLIQGNAFYSDIPSYGNEQGGSSEPGIVMVAYDTNMNGKPDDEWYELAGSEYNAPATIHGYRIVYYRPDPDKEPSPDITGTITDQTYIPWGDNQGGSGHVAKNMYHSQSYYPMWMDDDELVFEGTLLPPNGKDESGFGAYWVLYAYPWGYADNQPNEEEGLTSFDIDWAVDGDGNPVHLPGVDFVRVYTGVNQYCGWLGETSTEISHARDLHLSEYGGIDFY